MDAAKRLTSSKVGGNWTIGFTAMSSTAFDRLQPGQAKSVYSFNEFCYTCRLYIVTLHAEKALVSHR